MQDEQLDKYGQHSCLCFNDVPPPAEVERFIAQVINADTIRQVQIVNRDEPPCCPRLDDGEQSRVESLAQLVTEATNRYQYGLDIALSSDTGMLKFTPEHDMVTSSKRVIGKKEKRDKLERQGHGRPSAE